MMRLAEICAPYFDSAEVIELRTTTQKGADAPPPAPRFETAAGASLRRRAASAFGADPTETTVLPEGIRGGVSEGGVHVHSVRLAGLVAHQEVLFGTTGQSLIIRQDSYDRTSFMPGVLLKASCATGPGFDRRPRRAHR